MAKAEARPTAIAKKVEHEKQNLRPFFMHIIFDDDLHADAHMNDAREHKEQHQDRDERMGERRLHRREILADC